MIDQRVNTETENAGTVGLTVPDQTIADTEEATTLPITAQNAETITVENLWTDWNVTVPDAAGATTTDSVSDAGELLLEWGSVQGSAEPSIKINPPADTYVGGTYAIDVVAEGVDSAMTETAMIEIDGGSDPWAVEPGRWPAPESTFILPVSDQTGPDGGVYLPDLQESFPDVGWETLDRLYIPAGHYKFMRLGNLPDRSADDPLIITNKGGRVRVGGLDHYFLLSLNGGSNWVLTGRHDPIAETGHADYPGHGEGTFSDTAGRYGILVDDLGYREEQSNNGIRVAGGATDFEVEFTEVRNVGFAGMNIKTDDDGSATMHNVHVHDNYIHDAVSEGLYIGNTSDPPQHTIEGLEVNNNRVLRTGTEGIQLSQLAGDNEVHHNVVGPAAIDWRDAFQKFQDTNLQIAIRSGQTTVRENVFLGGTTQTKLFGLDISGDSHAEGDRVELRGNYFAHYRNRAMFADHRGVEPMEFLIKDNVYRELNFEYDEVYPDQEPKDALIHVLSDGAATLENNRFDFDKKLCESLPGEGNGEAGNLTGSENERADVAPVAFRNAGLPPEFDYLALEMWTDTASRHPDNEPVTYDTGDIVTYEGKPYRCKDGPSSTEAVPPDNPGIWESLDRFADDVRSTADSAHQEIGLQRPRET